MTSRRRICSGVVGLILAGLSHVTTADDWTYRADVYFLAADVDITTERGVEATAEFDDVLDRLEFAFFGSVAAKRDKLALFANVLYVDVSDGMSRSQGALTARREVELETFVTTLAAGWELFGSRDSYIHGLIGARLLALDTSLELKLNGIEQFENSNSTNNWEAVLGLQGRTAFSYRWYLNITPTWARGIPSSLGRASLQ